MAKEKKKGKGKFELEEYQIEFPCQNCKSKNWIKIPKGTTIIEYAEGDNPLCRKCNCPLIKIKENKE